MAEKKVKTVKAAKTVSKVAKRPAAKAETKVKAKAVTEVSKVTKKVNSLPSTKIKEGSEKITKPEAKKSVVSGKVQLLKTLVKTKPSQRVIKGPSVTIKQVASGAGRFKNQIQTLKGLGLSKLNKVSTLEDTPSVRGMIRTVAHLIEIVKN